MPPKYRLTKFPPNRIKKVMQQDDDIGKVVCSVPPLVSRVSELFLTDIMQRSAVFAEQGAMKTVNVVHLHRVVNDDKRLEFLERVVTDAEAAQKSQMDNSMTKLRGSGGGGQSSSTSNIGAMKKTSDVSEMSSFAVPLHKPGLKRAFSSTAGALASSSSSFPSRSPRGRGRGSFRKFTEETPLAGVLKRRLGISDPPWKSAVSSEANAAGDDVSSGESKRGRGRPRGQGRRVVFALTNDPPTANEVNDKVSDSGAHADNAAERKSCTSASLTFSSPSAFSLRLCRSTSLNSLSFSAGTTTAMNVMATTGSSLRSSPHADYECGLVIDEEFRKPLPSTSTASHETTNVSQQPQPAARNSPASSTFVINRNDGGRVDESPMEATAANGPENDADDTKPTSLTASINYDEKTIDSVKKEQQQNTNERNMALFMSFGPSSSLSSTDKHNSTASPLWDHVNLRDSISHEAPAEAQNSASSFNHLHQLHELVNRSGGTSSISNHVASEEASLTAGTSIGKSSNGSRRRIQRTSSRSTPVSTTTNNGDDRTSRNGIAVSANVDQQQQVIMPSCFQQSQQTTSNSLSQSATMASLPPTVNGSTTNNNTTLLAAILAAQQLLSPALPPVFVPPPPPPQQQLSISSILSQLINSQLMGTPSMPMTTSGGPSLLASPPPPLPQVTPVNPPAIDAALLTRLLMLEQQQLQQQQQQQANAAAALQNAVAAAVAGSGLSLLPANGANSINNPLLALLPQLQQQQPLPLPGNNPSPLLLNIPPSLLSALSMPNNNNNVSNNSNSNNSDLLFRSPQELLLLAALNSSNINIGNHNH